MTRPAIVDTRPKGRDALAARALPSGDGARSAIAPILRLIDLELDLDLKLAIRRAGRERRQEKARKGWRTRRGKR